MTSCFFKPPGVNVPLNTSVHSADTCRPPGSPSPLLWKSEWQQGSGRSLGGQWSSRQRVSEVRVPTQWAEAHPQDAEAGASFSSTRSLSPAQWLMVLIGFSSWSNSSQSFLYQGLKRALKRTCPKFLLLCQVLPR